MSVKFNFKSLEEAFEADWPVIVNVPQDGGTVSAETFMARFKLLSPQDLDAVREDEDGDAFIKAFWVGLGASEEGEFTPELVRQALGRQYVRVALITSYAGFAQGIVAKN